MDEVDLTADRLCGEEGFKVYPYDDATGERVKAPKGHLTWLYGLNLDEIGSKELGKEITKILLRQTVVDLGQYSWYTGLDIVRKSVVLDIAYNNGVNGLLHFPHMIAALGKGDWSTAAMECAVANPQLNESRYAPLRRLILSGTIGDVV